MAYLHGAERYDLLSNELSGKRLGLITNPSGVSQQLYATVDYLYDNFKLTALFSAEHGVRGDAQAGEKVDTYIDAKTSLPVYSMYGKQKTSLSEALESIDCLVYDIQDVGLRFYTYIYTLAEAMTAATAKGIPVVVLDRYDPLGLTRVEGTLLDDAFSSGVGKFSLPSRYGLTVGEFARYVNTEYSIGCDLRVIPCADLSREDDAFSLSLPWVLPSPNLPTIESTICYIGTVLFEGTDLSEGRGTTKPFELIGAPWLDEAALVEHFNSRGIDGALLRPAYFVPTFSKHKGALCRGFQIHILDRERFKPFRLGLELVDYISKTHGEFKYLGESENESEAREQSTHKVEVAEDSLLFSIFNAYYAAHPEEDSHQFSKDKSLRVNSFHHQAVKDLGEILGIDLQDMVAFGDDENDYEILQNCGVGVAVANAIPQILKVADEVTDSNDDDGVANYLERYL